MKSEPLEDWLWKYPSGTCPQGCEGKMVRSSACDKLLECKHGFWQPPCGVPPFLNASSSSIKLVEANLVGAMYCTYGGFESKHPAYYIYEGRSFCEMHYKEYLGVK